MKCKHFYLLPEESYKEIYVIGVCKYCGRKKKHLTYTGLDLKILRLYQRGDIKL